MSIRAWLIGVPWEESLKGGSFIGQKLILNEFVAYGFLGEHIQAGDLQPRSQIIATYALCGFANPGSIGIQLAVLSSLCPERRQDFAKVAFSAFMSGLVACFLTACIAGALIVE